MKKSIFCLLLLIVPCFAIETGTRTIGTVTMITGTFRTDIPGLPTVGPARAFTTFILGSVDESVKAFRLTIRTSRGSDILIATVYGKYAYTFVDVAPEDVFGVAVEELRALPALEF